MNGSEVPVQDNLEEVLRKGLSAQFILTMYRNKIFLREFLYCDTLTYKWGSLTLEESRTWYTDLVQHRDPGSDRISRPNFFWGESLREFKVSIGKQTTETFLSYDSVLPRITSVPVRKRQKKKTYQRD